MITRLTRWSGLVLLMSLCAVLPVAGQSNSVGPVTLGSTTCPPTAVGGTGCVLLGVAGLGSASIQVNGTGTWTAQFEGSIDGVTFSALNMTASNGTTPSTSTSAAGLWIGSVAGLTQVRVRLSAYTSGSPLVYISGVLSGGSSGAAGSGSNAAAGATGSAVPTSADYTGINIGGTLTGVTGLAVGTQKAASVAIVDAAGNQITTFSGNGGTSIADNAAFTQGSTVETPISGLFKAAYSAATDGRSTIWQMTSVGEGFVNVTKFAGTALSTGTGGGGAGIPRVTVSSDSNVLATQSGTWTVQPGNTANTTAWLVAGGKTHNNAAPGATNLGALVAVANASAPSFTEGNLVALSTDLTGALRVNANSGVAQGSTTSGQLGTLIQGAVTTAAPSYTTAQTSPFSLDLAGGLRVNTGASGATAAAVPANGFYNGINVAGNLRGQTGVNPTGSVFAVQQDVASIAGTTTVTAGVNGLLAVGGAAASGVAKSGNPLQVGGVFNTTQPTVTTGQAVEAQYTARGAAVIMTGVETPNFNLSQLAGTSVLNGNGTTGTGSLRVTVASDNSAVSGFAVGATGASVPANSVFSGVQVGSGLRGWTGVNPTGSVYAGQIDIASIGGSVLSATAYVPMRFTNGTVYVDPGVDYTHNTALTIATSAGPLLIARSSATAPTNTAADDNAVAVWALRNGAMATQLVTGGTLMTSTGTSLNVNCTGGCSSTSIADQSTFTQGVGNVVPIAGLFSNSYSAITSGKVGVAQMTSAGELFENLTKVGGTAIDTNSGSKSAGTIRVVLATDQPQLTAKLLVTPDANSSVNVAQINGNTIVTGGTNGTVGVGGLAAHNTAVAGNPNLMAGYASQAAPTDVGADGRAANLWLLRNGSLVTNIAAGGTLVTVTGSSLNTNVTNTSLAVAGVTGSGTTKSGNPIQVGGVFNTTQPTVTTGQLVESQYSARGGAIVATGVDVFHITCDSGCGGSGGTALADRATFTYGTTNFTPVGGVYNSSITALTSGQAGATALTPTRDLHVAAYDSGGTDATDTVNHAVRVNVVSGSTGNAAAGNTGSAVPTQADYSGLNVAGTLRGATGVNPSGSIYAQQMDLASVAGTTADTNSGTKSAGTLRMVLATDQPQLTNALLVSQKASTSTTVTLQSAAVANGNGTNLSTDGMSASILTVNCSSCSGGTTINFEGSEDNSNFTAVNAVQLGTNTIAATTTAAGVTVWEFPTAGFQVVRARISAYSAGTVTITGHTVPVPYNAKIVNANVVSHVALPAGANLIGQVATVAQADTTNSALTNYLASAASTNSTSVKGSAGNVYTIRAINTTSTIYYLRMYNSSSAPTCSSSTGFVESIPLPHNTGNGAGFVQTTPFAQGYTTGIGYCITGGSGNTDNTAAATGLFVTILYK